MPPPPIVKEGLGTLLRNLARFIRRPQLELPAPTHRPWWVLLRLMMVDLAFRMITAPLVLAGVAILGTPDFVLDSSNDELPTGVLLLFLAAVIAPLWEESAFRLAVHRFSEWRFWISITIWTSVVGASALGSSLWFLVYLTLPGAMILWRASVFSRDRAKESWNARPGWVCWTFALGFALLHISNYEIDATNWRLIAVVLLVAPQLIGGLVISYTRVRMGFWAGVLHHGISNGLLVSIVLLAEMATPASV